jgi:hypothetical protein
MTRMKVAFVEREAEVCSPPEEKAYASSPNIQFSLSNHRYAFPGLGFAGP